MGVDGVSGILDYVPSLSDIGGSTSDDWVDRISHLYTSLLLIIFAIAVSSGQFFGDPIHCWMPAEFTDSYEEYTNSYCWIKNTYYIPMSESIPDFQEDRESEEITYYQWVPLILLLQAFLFKIPNVAWRLLNDYSGVSLDKIINLCEQTQGNTPDERQETIENLAQYLDKWLGAYQHYKSNIIVRMKTRVSKLLFCACSRRSGTYLTGLYLAIKALYVINCVAQFFLLNAFMSQDYNLFGIEFIEKLARREPMRESPRFPRVTLCDFRIRQLQNVQPWTVQCVLPVNLFNEKIFIFIWFWLVFVAILSLLSLIRWIVYNIFKRDKVRYIKKFLKISKEVKKHNAHDKRLCEQFAEDYLRNDGIFVLYMIASNSSEMVVTDLVKEMWKIYKKKNSRYNNTNIPNNIDETEPLHTPSDEKVPLSDNAYMPQ